MKFLGRSGRPADKDGAYGRANRHRLTGEFQSARGRINAEYNHGIRPLILGQQPVPGRVNREVPRRLALSGWVFETCELARPLIHREHGNAVLPTV